MRWRSGALRQKSANSDNVENSAADRAYHGDDNGPRNEHIHKRATLS